MNIEQLKKMTRGIMLDAPENHGWAMYDQGYELVKTCASMPKPSDGHTICSRAGVVLQVRNGEWYEPAVLDAGMGTVEDDVRRLAMDAQSIARRFRQLSGGELGQDMIRCAEFRDFGKWLNKVADQLENAHKSCIKYAGAPQTKLDF